MHGDINIMDSLGIGTSIRLRGPPGDAFGAISYNKTANLILKSDVNICGTVILDGGDFTVRGNLTIGDSAALIANSNNIFIDGDWTNAGTFEAGTSTVVFENAAIQSNISGSTTFYNLTCITPGKELVFEANTYTTIEGILIIEGEDGNNVHLRSSLTGEGNEFDIYITSVSNNHGDPYLEYITVTDSDAYGPIVDIPCRNETVNGRNNTGWDDTHTWNGLGADNLASNGDNWVGGVAPAIGDSATFNAGSSKACTWDALAPASISQLNLAAYTGTLTLGQGLTATNLFTNGSSTNSAPRLPWPDIT